jgi:hypothetical protein
LQSRETLRVAPNSGVPLSDRVKNREREKRKRQKVEAKEIEGFGVLDKENRTHWNPGFTATGLLSNLAQGQVGNQLII